MLQQIEHLYCSQQIIIPPRFPQILNKYAQDAIRTQPHDLLLWSASYFRCLAEGQPVPAKSRIEVPPTVQNTGLTPGFIAVLIKQFGHVSKIKRKVLWKRWMGVCLCEMELKKMLTLGDMLSGPTIPWIKFVALMIGHLCNSLTETMIMFCEIMTEEPQGGSAMIPFPKFKEAYAFLAQLDCGSTQIFKGGRRILEKPSSNGELIKHSIQLRAIQNDFSSESTSDSSTLQTSSTSIKTSKKSSVHENEFFHESVTKSEESTQIKEPPEMYIESIIQELIGDEATSEFDLVALDIAKSKSDDGTQSTTNSPSSVDNSTVCKPKMLPLEEGINSDETDGRSEIIHFEVYPESLEEHKQISSNSMSKVNLYHDSEDSSKGLLVMSNASMDTEEESHVLEVDLHHDKKEKPPCDVKPKHMKNWEDDVIYIEPIKGIGPVVDDFIVMEFMQYMNCCAKKQHNMVMPRNLRHYNCPMLEPKTSTYESNLTEVQILI